MCINTEEQWEEGRDLMAPPTLKPWRRQVQILHNGPRHAGRPGGRFMPRPRIR